MPIYKCYFILLFFLNTWAFPAWAQPTVIVNKLTDQHVYVRETKVSIIPPQGASIANHFVDFIFFTGDLVSSGTNMGDFEKAQELLFKRLKDEFNLGIDRFFICPGNHDIDRTLVSPATIIVYCDRNN